MYSDQIPDPPRYRDPPRSPETPSQTDPPKRNAVWDRSGMQVKWRHDLFQKTPETRRQDFKRCGFPSFHVALLPPNLTETDIQELFEKFKSIKQLIEYDANGVFQGEVDVFFANMEDAKAAREVFDGATIDGQSLRCGFVVQNMRVPLGSSETTPTRSPVASGIEGKWKNDLYEKNQEPRRQEFSRYRSGGKGGKAAPVKSELSGLARLHIENLPIDLSQADIHELFQPSNSVKEVLYYDSNHVFQGEVDVFYASADDAVAAHKKYYGATMDEKPLSLMLVTGEDEFHEAVKVPISERLTYVGDSSTRTTKTVFKKNYGAPQRKFFHRTERERKFDKPYNNNFLDRLADDEEFQKEEAEKRFSREMERLSMKTEMKEREEGEIMDEE